MSRRFDDYPLSVLQISVYPKTHHVFPSSEIEGMRDSEIVSLIQRTKSELLNSKKKSTRLKKKGKVYLIENPLRNLDDWIVFSGILDKDAYSLVPNAFGIYTFKIGAGHVRNDLFPITSLRSANYTVGKAKYLPEQDISKIFDFAGKNYELININIRGNEEIFTSVLETLLISEKFKILEISRSSLHKNLLKPLNDKIFESFKRRETDLRLGEAELRLDRYEEMASGFY